MQGRTVRLFLVDGTPTGILTAEIMNWTGHALVTPRSRLPEALKRPEASRTGVYFLTGDDPEQLGKQRVYVGEGDNVIDRIKTHNKDESKDFWTHACIVTSKDANLTKAHVRYLESRLVELAKGAGRANVANGNDPAPKQLPESDVADMEFFLGQMQIVLPVVGLDFLRPKPVTGSVVAALTVVGAGAPAQLKLVLANRKHGVEATAIEIDGEVTVLAGSLAVVKDDFGSSAYMATRQSLIADGTLMLAPSGEHYVFKTDATLRSPSEAAAVILNRNSNGRTEWKVQATGQTLKDWQEAQLAAVPVASIAAE